MIQLFYDQSIHLNATMGILVIYSHQLREGNKNLINYLSFFIDNDALHEWFH